MNLIREVLQIADMFVIYFKSVLIFLIKSIISAKITMKLNLLF